MLTGYDVCPEHLVWGGGVHWGVGGGDELRAVLLKLSLGLPLTTLWRGGEWDLKVSSLLSMEKRI